MGTSDGGRAARGAHSVRDERRIDRLQELVTERVGRGAAVAVNRAAGGYRVVVFCARGEERIVVVEAEKRRALDGAVARVVALPGDER